MQSALKRECLAERAERGMCETREKCKIGRRLDTSFGKLDRYLEKYERVKIGVVRK